MKYKSLFDMIFKDFDESVTRCHEVNGLFVCGA